MDPDALLKRLDEIAQSLEKTGHALALIGLGSVGLELDRLDAFSDLDFFVIVEPGFKQAYLDDLGWLSASCSIAYHFANTRDGHKVLYTNGIFCEFAVFEPDELQAIAFAPGRIVWKQPHVPETISQPKLVPDVPQKRDQEWLLGEALTNLLVGLGRDQRGEKLSAMRFIQGYAVDRLVDLVDAVETAREGSKDPFTPERRFEQRYPEAARQMSACLQGYERNRESALAILSFLEQHFEVNEKIAAAIRGLCADQMQNIVSIETLKLAIQQGLQPEYLFFWSHKPKKVGQVGRECLSQWYASPFTVEGVTYPTAEHFMMAEKARLFGDDEIRAKILAAPDPAAAKALGKLVRNFDADKWREHRFDIIMRGNEAKFGQNERLQKFLSATNQKILVEASPHDSIWGVGLAERDPGVTDPQQWKGQNLLGFALMVVRSRL